MEDSLTPKKAPARRAQVFHEARERIVETDAVVHKTKEQLREEKYRHETTKRSRDLLASVISDPVHKAFVESLYRQVGAMMADHALEQIKEAMMDKAMTAATMERMRRYAAEAGDYEADRVLSRMLPRAEANTDAREMFESGETVIESRIYVPAIEVRYARAFSRRY